MAGEPLKAARERLGLSLEDVSSRTRIPLKWLAALESGDTSAFPPGPFLAGYSKQYRGFLGIGDAPILPQTAPSTLRPTVSGGTAPTANVPLASVPAVPRDPLPWTPAAPPVGEATRPPVADEPTSTLTTPRAREQRVIRMVGIGLLAAGVLLGGLWSANQWAGSEPAELGEAPDQTVLVTSAGGVGARVRADGREVHTGALPAGKQVRFAAHDRLEVELDALDGVTLVYNGNTLKPLGLQSRSRRLVFVDDAGG